MSRWIVCGVSSDEKDHSGLSVAARLGERVGARLAIVTVQPDVNDSDEVKNSIQAGGLVLERAARACGIGGDALHRVELGDPAVALIRVAHELEAEFVIVGSPRPRRFAARVGGTMAGQLVDNGGRPVVVVPPGSAAPFTDGMGSGGSIVCGLRSHGSSGFADLGLELARHLGVEPVFVTAVAAPAPVTTHSVVGAAYLRDDGHAPVEEVVESGEPARTLEAVAGRRRACAIVVASRGRGWLDRIVRGSVTEALTRRAHRPVFVMPRGA